MTSDAERERLEEAVLRLEAELDELRRVLGRAGVGATPGGGTSAPRATLTYEEILERLKGDLPAILARASRRGQAD